MMRIEAARRVFPRCWFNESTTEAGRDAANKHAKKLRPILTELAGLSANKAAAELNQRGVATPQGGQWHALTVVRLRQRLAAMT